MRKINIKKNKKGQEGFMGFVFFFLILFTILIIGFIGVVVVSVFDYTSEVVTPIMTDLGIVGGANLSEAGEVTFGTVDTIVDSLPWLLLFSYVAMLSFSLIFIISYNFNPNPAFIGVYFLFVVLLIFGSIVMSNMYQELISSNDEVIGDGLRSQTGMSYMILHSPWILGLFSFIVGIYIFAGRQTETEGGSGI